MRVLGTNAGGAMSATIVVPTIGRPSLPDLLASLARAPGPLPEAVVLVDDRPRPAGPVLAGQPPPPLAGRLRILRSGGRGPAAARNTGWQAASTPWVAFLDDDVLVSSGWLRDLAHDLDGRGPGVGGVQGRVTVPCPAGRRPTDWERNVAGLEQARWATADMAYRRAALASVGGFDERFPRAFREDADLALRVMARGWSLHRGRRRVVHPVRPAPWWVSVRLQAGNADDALMRVLHGRDWRRRAGAHPGRRPRHAAVTAAAAGWLAATATGRRRVATLLAGTWLAGTAELAVTRVAPGPRTRREMGTMLATSVVLPVWATACWARGLAVAWRLARGPRVQRHPRRSGRASTVSAVLFDRDGTLVVDVPYNGDPGRVVPMPGARDAIARLRRAGVATAVITNQGGVGRGLLTPQAVDAVNARVEGLLGPLGPWFSCTHAPDEHCPCRKPAAGMVVEAARTLGVDPARCVVVGDIGSDIEAATAAGARAVLVPTAATRHDEVASAPVIARTLSEAVDLILGGRV